MDSQHKASPLALVASKPATKSKSKIKLCSQAISPTKTVLLTQLGFAEMDSLISPSVRKRSDEFSHEEVELLVKEVGSLRHILLSRAPFHMWLKRRYWELVANSLASKLPNAPRRTGIQMRKKWENLVLKVRRKLKDGVLAKEMERNECLRLVVQYLIESNANRFQVGDQSDFLNNSLNSTIFALENSPELPGKAEFIGESNGNPNESVQVIPMKVDEPETAPATVSTGQSNAVMNSTAESSGDDESNDHGSSNLDTLFDGQTPTSNVEPCDWNSDVQMRSRKRQGLDRSNAEFKLRMKILDMKHRYWQLKYESLKKKFRADDQKS